jgi:hypothetical protein
MKIMLLGIDLAKNIFQLCALNQANKVLFNRAEYLGSEYLGSE